MRKKEIAERVQHYLDAQHPGGTTLTALADGVRHEQDWWYVPVQPNIRPPKRYEYYEALAEVELQLAKNDHLTVLLLPSGTADEDTALVHAIEEGQESGNVSREEVFAVLQSE